MNNKNNNNGQNSPSLQTGNQSAVLAVIGSAISTLGDGISTISAILALEEQQQANSNNNDNKDLQKQIDYLTAEVKKLKKQLGSRK
ncbi:hypothetical protein MHB48_09595 [Psychrobacillus sp. FSL H8-0483]|uniref:hypothetical protein n=1 Tax=Psychrobacillus sp. FSL H8-0483 TaxID=2921389 RepID=UPI00315B2E98